MLRSMTCFSRKEVATDSYIISMELRSVNSRFFDLHLRIPKEFSCIEDRLRSLLKSRLIRGRVDFYLYFQSLEEALVEFEPDLALARGYMEAVSELCKGLNIVNSLQVGELLRLLKDAIKVRHVPADAEKLWKVVSEPLEELLDEALMMSKVEGEAMEKDIKAHLDEVDKLLSAIRTRFVETVEEQTEALKQRIISRLEEVAELDNQRIIQEAAILADKLDINEELVRLTSHLNQFQQYLAEGGPVGRKLDFLVQELYREVNTIASKASDSTISHLVVDIKAELEKIREQLQNVV